MNITLHTIHANVLTKQVSDLLNNVNPFSLERLPRHEKATDVGGVVAFMAHMVQKLQCVDFRRHCEHGRSAVRTFADRQRIRSRF